VKFPASYQQRILHQAGGKKHRVRILPAPGVDRSSLKLALEKLTQDTEVLRTVVDSENQQLIQHVVQAAEAPLNSYCDGNDLIVEFAAECFDAGSLHAFLQGLSLALRGLSASESLQYADFATWQRGNENAQEAEEARAYWNAVLSTLAIQTPLEALGSNGYPQGMEADALHIEDVFEPMTNPLAQRDAALTAFGLLLARHQQSDAVLVDVCFEGRAEAELADLIGPLRSFAPIRIDTSQPADLQSLQRDINTQLQQHETNIDCFDELSRTGSHTRFMFEHSARSCSSNLATAAYETGPVPACELSVQLDERGVITLRSSTLSVEGLNHFAGQYSSMLRQIIDPATRSVRPLPVADLTDLTAQQSFNPYLISAEPDCSTLTDLLASCVENFPHQSALRCSARHLTFKQLEEQVAIASCALQARGIGNGDIVGLLFERSCDFVVLQHAIMRLGAAYLPLDPGYPLARLHYMVEDSGCKLVIIQDAHDLTESPAVRDCYVSAAELLEGTSGQQETNRPRPTDAAYLIYTSGSTGQPKGVRVSHGPVVNLLGAMRRRLQLRAADTVLSLTTASFDISVLELFLGMTSGSTTVIANRALATDPTGLDALVREERVTIAQATPSSWRLLVNGGWHGWPETKLLCGGEALSADLAEQLLARCKELWNVYGPTEATIWCTAAEINEPVHPITIGQALDNTQVWVLDTEDRPCGIGLPGEICVSGYCLAQGYHNRQELTEARFARIPGLNLNTRVYRTGDIGRWHADGRLECLGREDGQVKLRGYRIELGEVEQTVRAIPHVRDAAVVLVHRENGDQLVAYYEADAPIETSALTDATAQTLPVQMIPQLFVHVGAMPRTPAGKLDRAALPEPRSSAVIVQAAGAMETLLVSIWAELIADAGEFGVTHSFFEMGGDSLLAVRFCNIWADLVQEHVSVVSIFDHPTIREYAGFSEERFPDFAEVMAEERGEPSQWVFVNEIPAQTLWLKDEYPLSDLQCRTLFIDRARSRTPAFNHALPILFGADAQVEHIVNAFSQALSSFALLRCRLTAARDGIRVTQPREWRPEIELLPWPERTSAAQIITKTVQHRFDLQHENPVRISLHVGKPGKLLIILLHQFAADAASRDVVLARAQQILAGVPVEADDRRYWDVVAWRAQQLDQRKVEELREGFKAYIADSTGLLALPTDAPPDAASDGGGTLVFPIKETLHQRIDDTAAEHHLTWAMVYAAACFAVLHRWSGSDDILVGNTVGNRDADGLATVFGRLANMVIVRSVADQDGTIEDFLRAVRASILASFEFNHLPLIEQLRSRQWQVQTGRNMAYQVMFAIEEDAKLPPAWGGHLLPVLKDTAKYDLTFIVGERQGRSLELEFDTAQFSNASAARIGEDFCAALALLAQDPMRPLRGLLADLQGPSQHMRTSSSEVREMSWEAYEKEALSASTQGLGKSLLQTLKNWFKVAPAPAG